MDSFISWIGGKKLLRKTIVEQFPSKEMYNCYIEVFGGAAWVLFTKDKHAKEEVYNDTNGELVNLFRCVKYHAKALEEELQFTLMSREQFYDAVAQRNVAGLTDIQRAAKFFVLIKESYGSGQKTFSRSPINMNHAREYIEVVSQRLGRVVIEHSDFSDILCRYDREDALFYCDPPYYKAEGYYDTTFTPEDHERLKTALSKIKGRFVLSYNDCEYIRELYSGYTILAVDRQNNLSADKNLRYKELIIKNFRRD